MRRCSLVRRVPTAVMGALLMAVSAGSVAGQGRDFRSGMRTGVGYTAAFPDVQAGVGVWHLLGSSPIGVFADAKMTVGSLRDEPTHCPAVLTECSVTFVESQRNDLFIREQDEFMIANAGAMYALTPQFVVMMGAGAARRRTVTEYFDEEEEPITETGQFFVDNEPDPSTELQFVAGMLIRAGSHLVFRFGYETAPGGMSLGAYFALP